MYLPFRCRNVGIHRSLPTEDVILSFSLFPFLPCFSEKSREFVVENDTSYACGKKKPIFRRKPVSFPKTKIRREFK